MREVCKQVAAQRALCIWYGKNVLVAFASDDGLRRQSSEPRYSELRLWTMLGSPTTDQLCPAQAPECARLCHRTKRSQVKRARLHRCANAGAGYDVVDDISPHWHTITSRGCTRYNTAASNLRQSLCQPHTDDSGADQPVAHRRSRRRNCSRGDARQCDRIPVLRLYQQAHVAHLCSVQPPPLRSRAWRLSRLLVSAISID